MNVDYSEYIKKIADAFDPQKGLSKRDHNFLINCLENDIGPIYSIIYLIGRNGDKNDISLLRKFIAFNGSMTIPSRALRTLSLWIDHPSPYIKEIISGITGYEWDRENIHMEECIRLGGDILKSGYYNSEIIDSIRSRLKSNISEEINLACIDALDCIRH